MVSQNSLSCRVPSENALQSPFCARFGRQSEVAAIYNFFMLRRSRQGATEFTLLPTCWLILSAWDKSQTAATLSLTRCSSASLTPGLGLCLAPCWRVCHQHHRSLRLGGGERLMRVPTCLTGSSLLCSFTSCPSSHPACLPACDARL